jgi:hypothetical protein
VEDIIIIIIFHIGVQVGLCVKFTSTATLIKTVIFSLMSMNNIAVGIRCFLCSCLKNVAVPKAIGWTTFVQLDNTQFYIPQNDVSLRMSDRVVRKQQSVSALATHRGIQCL